MEQNDLQTRFETFLHDIRIRIEQDPIRSFFVGIGIGIVFMIFRAVLIPLTLILALVAGALYYFANPRRSWGAGPTPGSTGADQTTAERQATAGESVTGSGARDSTEKTP